MTTNNRYLAEEYRGRINRVMDHIERNDDLDEGKYVVARFELGPMDYEKAWGWLFGEWFPSSGFQPADGFIFSRFWVFLMKIIYYL
jgi:DNA gyrase inhibitor GyrI